MQKNSELTTPAQTPSGSHFSKDLCTMRHLRYGKYTRKLTFPYLCQAGRRDLHRQPFFNSPGYGGFT